MESLNFLKNKKKSKQLNQCCGDIFGLFLFVFDSLCKLPFQLTVVLAVCFDKGEHKCMCSLF